MQFKTSSVVLLTSLAVISTAAISRQHWHDPDLVKRSRIHVIEETLEQAPSGAVLLVGDSTAQRFYAPELCGTPVINAGIGRATVEEIIPLAQHWKRQARPRLIIVSGGLNNQSQSEASIRLSDAMSADYTVAPSWGDRPDGSHLSAGSYKALKRKIEAELCPDGKIIRK